MQQREQSLKQVNGTAVNKRKIIFLASNALQVALLFWTCWEKVEKAAQKQRREQREGLIGRIRIPTRTISKEEILREAGSKVYNTTSYLDTWDQNCAR